MLANLSLGPHPSGYSVIELAVVIVVAGLLALIATPTLARSWDVERVRSARATVTAIHAKARGVAIQRSSPVSLVIEDGTVLIRAIHPVLDVVDTVGAIVDLQDYYGVALVSTRDSLLFDARGIGKESSSTYLILSRNDAIDTLRVSQSGRFYP